MLVIQQQTLHQHDNIIEQEDIVKVAKDQELSQSNSTTRTQLTTEDEDCETAGLSSSSDSSAGSSSPRGLSVSFKDVSIREFNRIVGDHPDCKFGPPLTIGWEYNEKKHDIDEYETIKPSLSRKGSLKLISVQRRNILHGEFGIPLEDLYNPNTGDGSMIYKKSSKKKMSFKKALKLSLFKLCCGQEQRVSDGSCIDDCERMLEQARAADEKKNEVAPSPSPPPEVRDDTSSDYNGASDNDDDSSVDA